MQECRVATQATELAKFLGEGVSSTWISSQSKLTFVPRVSSGMQPPGAHRSEQLSCLWIFVVSSLVIEAAAAGCCRCIVSPGIGFYPPSSRLGC